MKLIATANREADQLLLQQMIHGLNVPNQLCFFANGQAVLDYLEVNTEQPFLILCDMNMPLINGLELRRTIDGNEYLRKKAIPFVFFLTDASPRLVENAYQTTIQGFFTKAPGYVQAKAQLHWIIGYWRHCVHPHNQD